MSRHFLTISCLLIIVVLASIAAYFFWFYQPDRSVYRLRGIDVSHHQGSIDWAKVAADDVAFAFIKASEGGNHHDARFAQNWLEAGAAGLAIGAYHFFSFCRSGREQAMNFIRVLAGRKGILPPALDLEFGGNCVVRPTKNAMKAEIGDFIAHVEAYTGQRMVLYVTSEFLDQYASILPVRPLWIRSIFRPPGRSNWTIWQYHHAGHVDGIAGRVDLNLIRQGTPLFEQLQDARRAFFEWQRNAVATSIQIRIAVASWKHPAMCSPISGTFARDRRQRRTPRGKTART